MLHFPRRPISALLRANLITAGSKTLPLRRSAAAATLYRRTLTYLPIRPTTGLLKSSRFHSPRPLMLSTSANCQREVVVKAKGFALLKSKLEKEGIDSLNLKPGKENRLLCPKCGGGSLKERCCSLFVRGDGQFAKWHCFRYSCGWKGLLEAFGECRSSHGATKISKPEGPRAIAEEKLQRQPLSMKRGGGSSKERSCSLFVRGDGQFTKWHCFRAKCVRKGLLEAFGECRIPHGATKIPKPEGPGAITEEELELQPLSMELLQYFSARGISSETLRRNDVRQRLLYNQVFIAFIYRRNGSPVSCKYRGIDKKFLQEPGTERIFYGLDDIKHARDIIIVEGEIDKLAMDEAGYTNCVSVPGGAPSKVSKEVPDEEKDTKFKFLWNCRKYLDKASRIILATDGDLPGQALAEEIARRVGKERCWRVSWPKYCKDANEVLMFFGRHALKEVIENAELYPIRGLLKFSDFFPEIDAYYHSSHGYEFGVSTGWTALDAFYRVIPGELTIISGVPNSGKSEWIDALLCNLNASEGWKFVLCSMENNVREHARKLLEKHFKKPFLNASYGESVERMSVDEFEEGKKWLDDTFALIRCEDDCLPSIAWVLSLAKAAVLRYGVRGLVIDPYNELDHQRPVNQTETEYVSQMLTKIKRFAQHHACHVWFVAHPKQLQQWGGGPPNLYDISGSAHFINKCDNGIVIHRNRDENVGPRDQVQVCVKKVRNKVAGQIGDAYLKYNRVTGEYKDIEGGFAICKPRRPRQFQNEPVKHSANWK